MAENCLQFNELRQIDYTTSAWMVFCFCLCFIVYILTVLNQHFHRVGFGLEPGAVGQKTDFKEATKRLEWGLKKAIFFYEFVHQFAFQ